jgi:acyl dehydratase
MMGRFIDELAAGDAFDLGIYQFTDENILRFSSQFVPVGFHMDDEAAAKGLFGGRVAAGWHICCGWMSCFVAANTQARLKRQAMGQPLPEIGPSPGLTELRWPGPVHAGEAIHYDLTVTGTRPLKSRDGWGMVSMKATGRNNAGRLALTFSGHVLVARR